MLFIDILVIGIIIFVLFGLICDEFVGGDDVCVGFFVGVIGVSYVLM